MRAFLTSAALAATLFGQASAWAQPPSPQRWDDRYDTRADRDDIARGRYDRRDEERYDDRRDGGAPGYDDRSIADMDAAQRRFDEAQARFERERATFEQEEVAYNVARGRFEGGRERLAERGPVFRGRDGRVACRRTDGTASTIVGGVVGGLLGNVIDGGRRRGVGTLLGAGAGGLIGNGVASSQYGGCR